MATDFGKPAKPRTKNNQRMNGQIMHPQYPQWKNGVLHTLFLYRVGQIGIAEYRERMNWSAYLAEENSLRITP